MTKAAPGQATLTMTTYQEAIEQLAQTNSDFVFPNSSHEHAAIVFSALFKYAQKDVLIYDDCLDGKIADRNDSQVTKNIKSFLNRRKSLRIVVKDSTKFDSTIYKNIKEWMAQYPQLIDVRKSSDTFSDKVKDLFSKDILFAVSDNKAIRIERAEGINERQAFCSFNKPEYANPLVNVFTSSFETCERISFQ